MLLLVGVLLSCSVLCLASPVPPATGRGCNVRSLILETLEDIQRLNSTGSSKIGPLNNMMEAGGNVNTYLKGFIEALKSSKTSLESQIAQKLQKIQAAGKSCRGWTEQDWEPEEEDDFFSNLNHLLRFLNHYALPEETARSSKKFKAPLV